MRTPHAVALLAVAPAFVLIACSPQSTDTGKPVSTTPAAPAAVASVVPAPARSDFVVEAPQGPPAIVPSVVGQNLQAAQDEARAASLSFRSSDALGQHRIQVAAQDWKVCSQIPAAGMRLATGGGLVLSTVKVEESCP
ncbi:PASTA domain-containing protein [Streptomyces erythrochromogenes]|uniref:hypothetical protein n=1 Tax=Streptomyces erythrochromogenes TaxID=285574 RepID=UPI0036D203AB